MIAVKRYPRNPRAEAQTTKRGPTGPPAAGWVVVGKPERVPAGSAHPKPSTRRWSCGDNAAICPAGGKAGIIYWGNDFVKPGGSSTRWTAPIASFSRKTASSSEKTLILPLLYLALHFSVFFGILVYPVDDFERPRLPGRQVFRPWRLPGRRSKRMCSLKTPDWRIA